MPTPQHRQRPYKGGDEESKSQICAKAKLKAQIQAIEAVAGISIATQSELSLDRLIKDQARFTTNGTVKVLSAKEQFSYPTCTVTIKAKVNKGKAKQIIGGSDQDIDRAIADEQAQINRLNKEIEQLYTKRSKTKQLQRLKKRKQASIQKYQQLRQKKGSANNMNRNERSYLYVKSNIKAEIYIDGKYADITPLKAFILKRGQQYNITAKAIDDEYFNSQSQKVKMSGA